MFTMPRQDFLLHPWLNMWLNLSVGVTLHPLCCHIQISGDRTMLNLNIIS